MISLGLSGSDRDLFRAALASTHSVRIHTQLLDLDHNWLSNLSDYVLDGQVNVDVTQTPTRTLNLSLLDPGRSLHFEANSPADGALYMNRMIRVTYAVKVPPIGWVDCPIFTGPVTQLQRQDDVVQVTCGGKELLAMGAAWKPRVWKRNHNRVGVIHDLMRDAAGETKFDLPSLPYRLKADLNIARRSIPWDVANKVARSMTRQLFYDGRGVLRLRNEPDRPVANVSGGDGGVILTEPQITYNTDNVKNIVWIKGGVPKGEKAAISYTLAAPKAHPLSPWSLGRNGVPRYILDYIENSAIRSNTEAKALAHDVLAKALLEEIDVSYDALPLPHLEENDLIHVTTSETSFTHRLTQFSLPLTTGATMSVNYQKRVSAHRRPHRRQK